MHTIISHLFHNNSGAIKILSTDNGYIKLQTLCDVKIYAHTQGVLYFTYYNKRKFAEYYVQLAELMRGENRGRWAARCYIKALDEAWRAYKNIAKYGYCYIEDNKECIDPYDLYKTARLYMLETGNTGGLKRLKESHHTHREYIYMELKYTNS